VDRDELTEAFVAASRALVAIAVHSVGAAPEDITVAQFRLLVIVTDGDRTVGELAGLLGVHQSNATRHCDRLQRLGLLERHRSADDRRVVQVRITDRGRQVVDAVMEQRRADVRRVLDLLPLAETEAALVAMRAFASAAVEAEGPVPATPW
jgi:DNA-binding MarR family transcriptional regulator